MPPPLWSPPRTLPRQPCPPASESSATNIAPDSSGIFTLIESVSSSPATLRSGDAFARAPRLRPHFFADRNPHCNHACVNSRPGVDCPHHVRWGVHPGRHRSRCPVEVTNDVGAHGGAGEASRCGGYACTRVGGGVLVERRGEAPTASRRLRRVRTPCCRPSRWAERPRNVTPRGSPRSVLVKAFGASGKPTRWPSLMPSCLGSGGRE